MNVIIVMGKVLTGGASMAACLRASYLAQAGHDVSLVPLDFDDNFNDKMQNLRITGRLDPSVTVVNPFNQLLSRIETEPSKKLPKAARSALKKRRRRERRWRNREYYTCKRDTDKAGNIVRESKYFDDEIIEDAYYSRSKKAYFVRFYRNGRSADAIAYDTDTRTFKHYTSYRQWQTYWLSEYARSFESKPIIICDSPRKLANVLLNVPGLDAFKVGQIHTNHFAEYPYVFGCPVKKIHHKYLNKIHRLDALVVLTRSQAYDIERQYGGSDRIRVIPNVVSDSGLEGIAKQMNRLVIFSRFKGAKRNEDAIKAMVHVKAAFPDAILDLFGEGPKQHQLEQLVRDLKLCETIRFKGYTLQAYKEMASSALTLLPTSFEGLPLVIAESMLNGTPVISSDVNYGPSELIDHERDGLLVPPGEPDALANQIIRLLRNPGLIDEMSRRGRHKVKEMLSPPKVISLWEGLFEELRRGDSYETSSSV